MQNGGRRPGPFHHVNDISVYLGRQRGEVFDWKNKLEALSCSSCSKHWSFKHLQSEKHTALGRLRAKNEFFVFAYCMRSKIGRWGSLALFPGPARSSLAVWNSRRGPGLVHHVMSATVVFLRQQIAMFAVLPIYMYNGVSSWNKSSTYDRL